MPTFNVFGRFDIDIRRSDDRWLAFRIGQGIRVPITDFVIPATLTEDELAAYLDDIYHELAGPGQSVRRLSPGASSNPNVSL